MKKCPTSLRSLTSGLSVLEKKSPDRLDALVWAITELMLGEEEQEVIVIYDAMAEVRELDLI